MIEYKKGDYNMDLVIMAAGLGSRFGGLKQIEPVNANGDFIIDYSIYDAIKCGFDRVVFIIKEENYEIFRNTIGKRIENEIKVIYVFQRLNDLPNGMSLPEGRVKPWGTAHALLACKKYVKNNFAVINADDFYGYDAFRQASIFLKRQQLNLTTEFNLIAYNVKNTLSENGATKRGVCIINDGKLVDIDESLIEKENNKIYATSLSTKTKKEIAPNTLVAMNLFCFTPKIFEYFEREFPNFLEENKDNILNAEFLMPSYVGKMIKENLATVKVTETNAKWVGVTYKEDKKMVIDALKTFTINGEYPITLWKANTNKYENAQK